MSSSESQSDRTQPATGRMKGRGARFESTSSLWARRSNFSAIAVAAVIIAGGNIVAVATLPFTQPELFGSTSPAVWLGLGLLMPVCLISCSLYRAYWKRKEDGEELIERIGPYILRERIGAGGMGEVFLAEHNLMKRKCAVKLINSREANNQEMRSSFEREAKATAQLTHWNTVEVYDYGLSEDGRFYYVMEYLEGLNLSQFIEKYGPMQPERVVYVLKQMCEALYEAECVGLVHRDIKPSNIFLTERGRSFDVVKLLDFGLVQASGDEYVLNKVNTKLRGSPAYMCPEQAVGLNPDCRGDLYSLGCVAYFLLTGRPPFIDENPVMLIVSHATADVPSFEEIGADVPTDIASVVLKCLKRDAKDRFSSARELLNALDICECSQRWSWKDAEEWWERNQPSIEEFERPTETGLGADTATIVVQSRTSGVDDETLVTDNPMLDDGKNITVIYDAIEA